MTDWIEHNGGPQPVADDVWVGIVTPPQLDWWDIETMPAKEVGWGQKFEWSILNQHLIDAARLEGIRLGLEAAHMIVGGLLKDDTPEDHANLIMRAEAKIIFALENPETIAREAALDTLTSEAQEQNMGYDKETER